MRHLSTNTSPMASIGRVNWGLVRGLAIHVARWAPSPNIVNIQYRFLNLVTPVSRLPCQLCPHPCVGMVTGHVHCVRVATNCWHHHPMFQCSNVPMSQVQVQAPGHSLGHLMLLPASTSQDLDTDSLQCLNCVIQLCLNQCQII